jgi:heme-degrading monooxygenase HmoA
MFARVQTVHQPAEKLDELTKLAREQLETVPDPPGYRGFYYLIDRNNGKALVISFWETEEDLRQLEADNAAMREHIKAEAALESPLAETFEVALQMLHELSEPPVECSSSGGVQGWRQQALEPSRRDPSWT